MENFNFDIFNSLNARICNRDNDDMEFEQTMIFNNIPALYCDMRYKVYNPDFFTVDAREADDGDDYIASLEDSVLVNFSGRFIVPEIYRPELVARSEEPDGKIGIYTYTNEPGKLEYIDIEFVGDCTPIQALHIPFDFERS